jgi:hypothetical protein
MTLSDPLCGADIHVCRVDIRVDVWRLTKLAICHGDDEL